MLVLAAITSLALMVAVDTTPAHGLGTITSQGVRAHLSSAWNQAGYSGQGVKVGVIDVGFLGYQSLMGTELPATVKARCYTGLGRFTSDVADCDNGENHGTLVAESLVDIAPEVSLYIAVPRTLGDLRSTVDWMISEGVSVINQSLFWAHDGPGDGTSPFNSSSLATVDRAVDANIAWVNAAGNAAQTTWFTRAPVDADDDRWLNFSEVDERNTMSLKAGDRIVAQLRWEGEWGRQGTDLDLFLYDSEFNILDSSEDRQSGPMAGRFPVPWELIFYEVPTDGVYSLSIRRYSGSLPDWVQLMVGSSPVEIKHRTLSGSIENPAESANPGMLAVGAAHWTDTNTIEPYSSRGPTPDGRVKPDIVGAACGETSQTPLDSHGNGFCGTSQAAPHVAGMVALVRQRFPNASPSWVTDYLNYYAVQRSSPDPNNTWGSGFARMPPPSPPSPPVINPITQRGLDWVIVTWEPPIDGYPITAYDLRYIGARADPAVAANWTMVNGVWPAESGSPEHLITGLNGGDVYKVQMRAMNVWGPSPWSTDTLGTTLPPITPGTPTGLTPGISAGEAKVDLSWTAPTFTGGAPITGYRVESSPNGTDPWTEVFTTTGDGTTYTDDGADANGPMFSAGNWPHYRVAAVNRVGTGPFSESKYAGGDPLVNSYDVNGNGTIERSEVIAAINDYLFAGAISRGDVIRLINLYLFGPSTQHNRPGAPEGLTAAVNGQTRIDLSWTAPSDDGGADITGYKIEVSPNGSSWSDLEANTRSTSTSYSHSSLTAGSTRHYRVSAINSVGTGPASNVVTGTTETDRTALSALYNATDGANWHDKDNWQSEAPMGEWYGVTTDSDGRVTHLVLSSNQLTGEIPAELGGLTNLAELSLYSNQLTGEIPAELGDLTNLAELSLYSNELTGEIPAELGSLTNLTELYLSGNELTGEIPAELGGLTNLEELWLSFNQLTGEIPAELGSLTNLAGLYLSRNQLTGEIPAELGSLTNLEGLYLSSNQLTGEIPAELGSLTNLAELYLFSNELTGEIPAELGSLTNLEGLSLSRNELTGEIPAELGSLTNLEGLSLSRNQLTGEIPAELGSLTNLEGLQLSSNELTGEIPAELGSLTNLEGLQLSSNELTGEIPAELGSLTNLVGLALSSNELTGEIPAELGSLTNLEWLQIQGTQLTGEIPPELGSLTNLVQLFLPSNELTGEIPTELGGLTNLAKLSLSGNELTGEIPAELGGLTNLAELSLSFNQLTGEIPTELGGLTNLAKLSLSGNELTGEIPAELGGLTNLAELSLYSNELTGEIPTELGSLTNLVRLVLYSNELTGEIPTELGSLTNLVRLALSFNQLTGEIPAELVRLPNLEWLYLQGNQLAGCIPAGLLNTRYNDFPQVGLPFCGN